MKIEFELTEDDLVAFSLFDQRNAPRLFPRARSTGHPRMLVVMAVLTCVMTVAVLVAPGKGKVPLSTRLAAAAMVLLAMPMLLLLRLVSRRLGLYRFQVVKQVRRNIASGRVGSFKPVTLEATPEGFQIIHSGGDARLLWTAVQGVAQDDNAIYIYTTATAAYIVPRRAFADSAQAQEFYEAALRCVEAGKK